MLTSDSRGLGALFIRFARGHAVVAPEPLRVAGFGATWPIDKDAPLNPDGSVRSF